MTKLHIMSDMHLEFKGNRDRFESLIQDADILVCAGDLHVGLENTINYLNLLAKRYKYVVYVLGNHELYEGLSLESFTHEAFGQYLPNNVFFLNPGTVILEHITFIGAPLWTNFRDDPRCMAYSKSFINDFRKANVHPQDYLEAFNFQLKYMKGMYQQTEGKRVFVTHFMPAKELIASHWANHPDPTSQVLNGYFANDLGDYISKLEDATWIFGHTHDSTDAQIGSTRCIANPLGYPGEKSYQPLIIEI